MKKYLLLLLTFICFASLGQTITINPATQATACFAQNITINFTPAGGAIGPYTVELIEKVYITSQYQISQCNQTTYSTKATANTSTNTATITIPQYLNTSFDPSYPCYGNQFQVFYAYRYQDYFFRVTGSNGVSNDQYINLNSTCTPTLGVAFAPTSICAGKTGNANWYSAGANAGNVFTVELSNSSGSFSSPISLGTLSGNNADGVKTLAVVIPANTVSGSGYKIKVKSSDPVSEKTIGFTVNSASICGPVQAVVVPTPLCSGATSTVSYTLDDVFQSGNVFTAQLSDQNGSFTSPTTIGSITSQTATSFPITLPANLPYGGYNVRVIASLPSLGSPYTSPISNYIAIGLYQPTISGSSAVCENSVLDMYINSPNPESAHTFTWKKNNVSVNASNQTTNTSTSEEYFHRNFAQASDAGSYTIMIVRNADGCSTESAAKVVTINTASAAPVTSPMTVLNGNTASLTASNCTGTIYWYNSNTVSVDNYIGQGTYTTPELTQQTTYYAACRQTSGSYCTSTRTPLVVSVDATNAPNAPTLIASDNNFCQSTVQSPKLTATGCDGGIVRWYYKYNLTDINFYLGETDNAAPYEYNISNYETRIYAADCRFNGILSTTKTEFIVTVKPIPSSPTISPNSASANNGSTVSLTASNCSGTVTWFSDYTTTAILATGNTYTTPILENNVPNTTVYYTIYTNCTVNGCTSSRSSSTIYIYNSLQYPTFSYSENNSSVCSGNTKTIFAHGCSNGTVNWYNASSNGNLLGTGFSYTTPVMTYNNSGNNYYNYYADCTIGANTSGRNSASINIYRQPTTPSANQPTIACNATATLTATGCSTSSPEYFYVYWYANATTQNNLSSSTTFTTPNLSATTVYYVECRGNGDCKSPRIPITVTVGCTPPNPPVISASATTVCAGTGINLSATGCANTVNWSDGGVGTSRSNVVFNANITLTATCNNGLASGNSNSISIIVNSTPILLITNPAAVAPPNTVDITAGIVTTGSTLYGASLSYHTDMAGAVSLPNPATIAVSNTYYIKATTTAGCTDIKPVVVVISDCGTAIVLQSTTDNYSSGTYLKKTNETITASNIISGTANVTYRSNKSITLSPQINGGFKAENGAVFKAEIGGCN